MRVFYTFSIYCYYTIIWLAQFFNPKAKKWIDGRKHQWTTFPQVKEKQVIWFHCASLGEFDQGVPLMRRLKEENPAIFLLVTFFSPSGMEHYHKRNVAIDFACYLPIDTPKNAKKLIQHFHPKAVYFVKYEFWYHFINELKKSDSKLYSICAIFRENHRFFKWYGGFFRQILRKFDHFFVQNEQSINLLHSIGILNCTLVGDMRFDRVIENKKSVVKDPIVEQFLKGKKAFILGSSWSVDEAFLETFIHDNLTKHKFIIAPHDIKEAHLKEIDKRFPLQTVRYERFEQDYSSQNILVIDCIGKLSNIYQYGQLAYIGGGFTGSLHNILEPAVFGLPVLFGPKHKRFPEAQLFIDKGVGFSLSEKTQLETSVDFILTNQNELQQKLEHLIQTQAGAVDKILKEIK